VDSSFIYPHPHSQQHLQPPAFLLFILNVLPEFKKKRIFLFILRFSTFSGVKKLFKHVENPCVKTPYVRFSCLLRAVDKLHDDLMN
jgi:hypothetical protein